MKTEKPKKLIRWYILGAIGAVLTILAAGIVVPALSYLLSFAAGAMLYVVFTELLPESEQLWQHKLSGLSTMLGLLLGMALIFSGHHH